MYGGALPIAKSRKSKKRAMTEAEYVEDAPEAASKKAKKSKAAPQEILPDPEVLSIQQESQELDASEVLDKRTRSKKPANAPQSSIPKKKRKMAIKKLRQASLAAEKEEEAATSLVSREILKRKAKEETVVKKALEIAAQISVPSDVLMQKTTSEVAQAAIELSEDLQQLIRSEAATLEAAASRGNSDLSHSVIEVESRFGNSISSPNSSDLEDVTLSLLYKNISPSSKQKQKVNTEPFEPVYPAVRKSIREMSQMRVDICNKLPANHPFQPPMVEPLNIAPANAKGSDEPAISASTTTATSSQSDQPNPTLAQTQAETDTCEPSNSQPKSPTKLSEPNVLDQLVSHYSGELPEVESELQKASEVASDEVASESPQQQSVEPQTASTKIQIIPEYIESTSCTEEVSESEANEMEIEMTNSFSTSASNDMTETNIPTTMPTIPTNNQPSSSHLAIQPITPPKPTNIPFPPTMYLDSSLLVDVCENIFRKLNRLTQTRHDLIHEQSYEKSSKRLKERAENVLNALQRTCMDDQDNAQQKLKDWLKGVTSNLEEVRVLKTWVKHPLCLRQRNETDFISAEIHPRELNVNWLTRMNVKQASPELVVLQRNVELENENRQLKKELLE